MEPFVACNIDQILVSNAKWMEKPSGNKMEQVRDLLALIDHRRLDGVLVASSFIFWCVQPSKERAHLGYEF